VKEITSPAVYVDMLAGDTSILRKVFGIISQASPLCIDVYFVYSNTSNFFTRFYLMDCKT